jgi:DNA-binding response OmpR family regulator
LAKGRVLVAHGNADCLKIYGSVLAFDGYSVEIASDGDTAIELLAAGSFDVVVTDLYVQSVVDECLVRQIRARDFSAHIPVVVITGWTTDQHRRIAMNEGADAFLPLPLRPRELLDVIDQLFVEAHGPVSVIRSLSEPRQPTISNGL